MKQILVVIPLRQEHKAVLERQAPGCHVTYSSYKEATPELARQADIIFGNVEPSYLAECTHLELLQLNSAGANPYVSKGIMPDGAVLTCATGAYGLALSEHMLGMLLAMKKRLYQYHENQKQTLWRDEGSVTGIYGTRTLIVGLGDVGTEFAKRMKAMGSYVIGIRRTADSLPEFVDELYTTEALESQLPLADTVALTLPGTDATYHLMNKERLLSMKPGSFLLNIGRGSAIDSDALYEVMKSGRLAGAALDVTEPEPLPAGHPLWRLEGVHITPHISGDFHLEETRNRIVQIAAENISRHLKGEPLINVIDPALGYRKRSSMTKNE